MTNTPFKVLHTADWHLGKTLCDQSREDEHAAFLLWLLQQIRDLKINVLIIAGDVFDSANPPNSATAMYYSFLFDLHSQTDCEVVVIGGNHDSAAQLEAVSPILKTHRVHVVGAMPELTENCVLTFPQDGPPQLAIAAIPFLRDRDIRISKLGQQSDEIRDAIVAGITTRYTEAWEACSIHPSTSVASICTGHLTVANSSTSESEREIHIGGLGALSVNKFPAKFVYVALGHIHKPQSFKGSEHIRYSGCPIPLSFSEADDAKEIRLLQFSNGKLHQQDQILIPVHRKLLRLSCKASEAVEYIKGYVWPEFPSGCFVELTLNAFDSSAPTPEQIRAALPQQDIRILQISAIDETSRAALRTESLLTEEAIRSLRDEPLAIFKKLLESEVKSKNLSDVEVQANQDLLSEFQSILEQLQSSKEEIWEASRS